MRSIATFARDIIAAIRNHPTSVTKHWIERMDRETEELRSLVRGLQEVSAGVDRGKQHDGCILRELVLKFATRAASGCFWRVYSAEELRTMMDILHRMPKSNDGQPIMIGDSFVVPGADRMPHFVTAALSVYLPRSASTPSHAGTFNPQPAPAAPAG